MIEPNLRWVFICCITVLLHAGPAYPADDPVKHAMTLYKMHRYEDAAGLLRSSLASLDAGSQDPALLGLGLVYLKDAELHRELYVASTSVHLDYLKKLSIHQGEERSRLVDLYMGEALLEAGRPGQAERLFKNFISAPSEEQKYVEIARVKLGLCYHLQGKGKQAKDVWKRVKRTDPEVVSELAMAYSRVGLAGEDPEAMCDNALALVKQSGKGTLIRVTKNALGVYAKTGLVEKGLNLLGLTDLKAFSSEEILGKNKVLRFYNLALLDSLANLYGKASIEYLNKVTADHRSRDAANYYLGEAYAILGSFERSAEVTSSLIGSTTAPRQFKDKARLRQALNRYLQGDETEAKRMLEDLSRQKAEPYLLADFLLSCSRLPIECEDIITKASDLAATGEGRQFAAINYALGKYYLWKKDYDRALSYMEAGRDKSYKNSIEYNDPVMLVSLAEAYYRSKRFSEALEIYFEMSKQFPAIRQIQVVMQGVYSMEQKSAGDARIL